MGAEISEAMAALFPVGVIAVELREPGDVSTLSVEESEYVSRAVPERAREFAAGRTCARRALREWGIVDFPLRVGARRQPVWPDSMTGSITHTDGLCVAVVAARGRLSALGIDSELSGAVKEELWPTICVPQEIAWLRSVSEPERVAAASLIFSAKEAFFKCQYMVSEAWVDFHDLCIGPEHWGAAHATFSVRATTDIAFARHASLPMIGRYRFHEEFVSTGIALEAPAR